MTSPTWFRNGNVWRLAEILVLAFVVGVAWANLDGKVRTIDAAFVRKDVLKERHQRDDERWEEIKQRLDAIDKKLEKLR